MTALVACPVSSRGECVWQDGFQSLWQRVAAADGLIFASPVYVGNYGAALKRWVDRAFVYVHRPALTGLPALAVSTAGGSYSGKVNRLMLSMAAMFGMRKAGAVARIAPNMHKPVLPREVKRFARLVQRGVSARPTPGMVMMFQASKFMSCFSPAEQAFWRNSGWDRRVYLYEDAVGWTRPLAWLLDRVLFPLVKRTLPDSARV